MRKIGGFKNGLTLLQPSPLKRVVAFGIDVIVFVCVYTVLAFLSLLLIAIGIPELPNTVDLVRFLEECIGSNAQTWWFLLIRGTLYGFIFLFPYYAVWVLLMTLQEASKRQATIGKGMLDLKVVTEVGGCPTFQQIIKRNLLKPIYAVAWLGQLPHLPWWIVTTSYDRPVYDCKAGTLVVYEEGN